MKFTALLALIAALTSALSAQISEGETAPDFTLPILNTSATFTLSEHTNKVVYIFFYGANCSHCKNNGPVTESDIYQIFKSDTNFVAIGIDTWNSNASSNNAFQNITGITYPLLLNGQQSLVDYYGNTTSYDRSLVVGFDNTVIYKGETFVSLDAGDVKSAIEDELAKSSTAFSIKTEIPSQINLLQNYPNPFNPSTNIQFKLDQTTEIELAIFDVIGNKLSTLAIGTFAAGTHSVQWHATNYPSGVYLYRLQTPSQTFINRMILVK